MAFADLGSLGATGSTANNQTVLDLTTTAAIAAGELVVVVCAADNIANGGDDNAVSGVTLGVGGQAFSKAKQIANALAAQAGASSSLWYLIASSSFASGGIIRATFGSGTLVDASALTARHFSKGASATVEIEGTPGTLVNNTGADPASLNVTTANIACLRIRGIASQVGNNTNLTPTSTWTAWANGNSATTGTTGEMCARAEHLISTATGAASDPTYVSAIYASAYVAFKETILPTTADGDADGIGTATATGAATKAADTNAAGVGASSIVGAQTAAAIASTKTGTIELVDTDDAFLVDTDGAFLVDDISAAFGAANADGQQVTGITASAAGAGAAAAVGTSIAITTADGAAAGIGAAGASGASVNAVAASAVGTGAASATGNAVAAATANATAIGAASATGAEIVYLRPDGDVATDGWTDQDDGTSNIYQFIDEAVIDDADYVQSPSVVGSSADLKVRLYEGATLIAEWTHSDISDTFVTATQTLTTPEFETIVNFGNLFVELDDDLGNTYRCQISDPASGAAEPVKLHYRYKKLAA